MLCGRDLSGIFGIRIIACSLVSSCSSTAMNDVKTRENGRNVKPILEHSRGGPRPRGSRPEGLATAA